MDHPALSRATRAPSSFARAFRQGRQTSAYSIGHESGNIGRDDWDDPIPRELLSAGSAPQPVADDVFHSFKSPPEGATHIFWLSIRDADVVSLRSLRSQRRRRRQFPGCSRHHLPCRYERPRNLVARSKFQILY